MICLPLCHVDLNQEAPDQTSWSFPVLSRSLAALVHSFHGFYCGKSIYYYTQDADPGPQLVPRYSTCKPVKSQNFTTIFLQMFQVANSVFRCRIVFTLFIESVSCSGIFFVRGCLGVARWGNHIMEVGMVNWDK